MLRSVALSALVALACVGRAFAADPPSQWLLVTAPAFRQAVQPLIEHRQREGLKVSIVQTTDLLGPKEILLGDSVRLAERVHRLCREWPGTTYVVLVGAVDPSGLAAPERKVLPPLKGSIGRMKNQPSDNGFGCPEGGRLPTVAIGRLPARSEDEARHLVHKILAYERDAEPGQWRQRITVLAGVPAFNPLVDRLVESMALARFARLDPSWSVRAIYHHPQSRFCLPDEQLHGRAVQYVGEGQALTLYLGHSWAKGFYAPHTRFLDWDDWAQLKIARGGGVFAVFGCNGCQLAGPEGEGYGVAAMRNPRGPVAVMGSHASCFAAMCQLAADGLLASVSARQPPQRLAEVWLKLKDGIARGKMDCVTFRLLDAVDGDRSVPQAFQRQEHLEMFLLLGDPALRLPRIEQSITLAVSAPVKPGGTITVTGTAPETLNGAPVQLALHRPLTSEPPDLQPVPAGPPAERDRIILVNHERANQFLVEATEAVVEAGRFTGELHLPDKLPWPELLLRAYAATESTEGMGVLILQTIEE